MDNRTDRKLKLLDIISWLQVVSLHCIDDLQLFLAFHWLGFNNYKKTRPHPIKKWYGVFQVKNLSPRLPTEDISLDPSPFVSLVLSSREWFRLLSMKHQSLIQTLQHFLLRTSNTGVELNIISCQSVKESLHIKKSLVWLTFFHVHHHTAQDSSSKEELSI